MNKKKKILFAAGGTGGHFFPALAVAKYINEHYSDEYECIFIGTKNRIESKLAPDYGFKYYSMPIVSFPGKNLKSLTYPANLYSSIRVAKKTIKDEQAVALVCTGAYICLPPGLAAKSLKIPIFLMESNVNPGKSIAFLAPSANRIYTSFDQSTNFFKFDLTDRISNYGNPTRDNLNSNGLSKTEILNELGFDINKKSIFVFGGSLGATSINEIILALINSGDLDSYNVYWQTGENFKAPKTNHKNLYVTEFIKDMQKPYYIADLVICRSGATTVAELAILQKPAILIPLRTASNNEQYMNAKTLSDSNAAFLFDDNQSHKDLIKLVKSIFSEEGKLETISKNICKFAKPKAAKMIAEDIISNIKSKA